MTAQAGDTASIKAALRREIRAARSALSADHRRHAARAAARLLAGLPAVRCARRIAIYLEHGSELSTACFAALCRRRAQQLYVPKLLGSRLRFVPYPPGAALRRNRYGIREPAGRAVQVSMRELDVIVMPLVGFDSKGHRLGTGGGFYDRALVGTRIRGRPLRIGYAYAVQECAHVPVESWDLPLDAVVTEKGVRRWRIG